MNLMRYASVSGYLYRVTARPVYNSDICLLLDELATSGSITEVPDLGNLEQWASTITTSSNNIVSPPINGYSTSR